jgi:hypothetical protein
MGCGDPSKDLYLTSVNESATWPDGFVLTFGINGTGCKAVRVRPSETWTKYWMVGPDDFPIAMFEPESQSLNGIAAWRWSSGIYTA